MTETQLKQLPVGPLVNRTIPQEDADQLYKTYKELPRSHFFGCPSCGKNQGFGRDGILELDGEEVLCNCHDQLQRCKHYLNAGIGMTYQFLDWKDFTGSREAFGEAQRWSERVAESVESGTNLYLHSRGYGSGKTLLSTLALRRCIVAGHSCYMTTFQNMLAAMKRGWSDGDFDKWYKGKVESARVLLIDDLGKELMEIGGFNNEYARQTLDNLLRTRTQQGRPLIFTSNLGTDELGSHYGPAVVSLFNETTIAVRVDGEDYRKKVVAREVGKRRIY